MPIEPVSFTISIISLSILGVIGLINLVRAEREAEPIVREWARKQLYHSLEVPEGSGIFALIANSIEKRYKNCRNGATVSVRMPNGQACFIVPDDSVAWFDNYRVHIDKLPNGRVVKFIMYWEKQYDTDVRKIIDEYWQRADCRYQTEMTTRKDQ